MATVGAALTLACAAFLIYDQLSFRDSMRSDLGVQAEIFGSNSTAAWEAEPAHQDYLERYPNGYACHFVRPDWKLPVRAEVPFLS